MPGIADQYRTIAAGTGWRRRLERGRLRVVGSDRHAFLQALLTNDIAPLTPGQGTYAAYLTPQGRMIADLHVYSRPDHFVVDVPAAGSSALAATLDQLVFAEQVEIQDATSALAQISVAGGLAADVIAGALELDVHALRRLAVWSQLEAMGGFVARTDDAAGVDSFDVIVQTAHEAALVGLLSSAGASEMSTELWNAVRIDAGRPAFGVDMDTATIPLEAGLLERGISTTKGCYVGQEVIIRVLHRGGGRVARRLVKIAFDPVLVDPPHAGSTLHSGGRHVGTITSAAPSLDGSHVVAIASVHRDEAEIGRTVSVGQDGPAGTITAFAG